MGGRITITPRCSLCCETFAAMMSRRTTNLVPSVTLRLNKLKKDLSQNSTCLVFSLLFALLLFVLFVTNQKPRYTHSADVIYDEHSIHDKPNSDLSYGVVVDCGSSGSRVYIMYWPPHTGSKTELLKIKQMIDVGGNPVRKKIKPGISSYAEHPANASESLRTLLEFAGTHVPRRKHQETPLYVLSTAGMRLLPKHKQHAILHNLRKHVPTMTKFYVADSHIEIITGKQEGIYLWIATNYALGRFDHTHDDVTTTNKSDITDDKHVRKPTVGVIEIGGASLQISYEVPWVEFVPVEQSATINLGCDTHETIHEYKVYVTTHLGYGTDAARRRYVDNIYSTHADKLKQHEKVTDPCLPAEMVDDISVGGGGGANGAVAAYKVTGTGEFSRCRTLLQKILNESIPCQRKPCSLNGVFQPTIDFGKAEFYGFAEFWYSSNDVFRLGEKYRAKLIDAASKDFCKTPWTLHRHHYKMGLYPRADFYRFKYQCFKSAWLTTVLHRGLKFPDNYNGLKAAHTINGKEVQWAMGALLYRTRFFPMRDIKNSETLSTKAQQHIFWLIFHNGVYPIILMLILLVVVLVFVYFFHRVGRYSNVGVSVPGYRDDADKVSSKEFGVYDLQINM